MPLQHAIEYDHRQIFKICPTKRWQFWQEKMSMCFKRQIFFKFSNFTVHIIIETLKIKKIKIRFLSNFKTIFISKKYFDEIVFSIFN